MPKMSMTMTEGELLVWHVEVGQEIKAGDVVCEVATDKVDMEVESTTTGTVTALIGNPGDVMDVGTPLIMVDSELDDVLAGIFDEPEAPAAAPVVAEVAATPAAPAAPAAPVATPVVATPVVAAPAAIINTGDILATPKARDTATNMNVDLRTVHPTGTDGVITTPDVLGASRSAAPVANPNRTIANRLKTRRAIARAIEASADIPTFSMTFEVVAPRTVATDEVERTAVWACAWARTLQAFPELHAAWNGGDIETFADVRVAFNVMAAHGVVTPSVVIPRVINDSFVNDLRQILANAGHGKIALEHLASSTTGLADLGDIALTASSGILINPQSTSIAVGKPTTNAQGIKVIYVTINADHRVSDPADVALLAQRFAAEIVN